MALPTSPPASMSVNTNIYPWAGIPTTSQRSISRDLFPYVGGVSGTTCRLGQDFSGKVYGNVNLYTNLGNTNSFSGNSITADSSGNIYITGQYVSALAVTINTMTLTPASSGKTLPAVTGTGMFALKYNSSGTLVSYTYLGGTVSVIGSSIAVDSSQNVYITGSSNSASAVTINTMSLTPTSSGRTLPISAGDDMFVLKYNSSGTLVSYTYFSGSSGNDVGSGIAVNSSSQEVYIIGRYVSASAVTINTMTLTPTSSGRTLPISTVGSMFVLRYNSAGTLVSYTYLSGTGSVIGNAIAVDSSLTVYVTGQYTSGSAVTINTMTLTPTSSGKTLPISTSGDMFAIAYTSSGSFYIYTYLSGTGTADSGLSIAVDSSLNVYITGRYNSASAVIINTMAPTPTSSGKTLPISTSGNMFVLKYSAGTLNSYTYLAGSGLTIGSSIVVDSSQNVYVGGRYTAGTAAIAINTMSLTPTSSGKTLPISTGLDMFTFKYNSSGTLVSYTYFKGNSNDLLESIAVDSSQNVYITGQHSSSSAIAINTMSLTPVTTGKNFITNTAMFALKYPKT